ncbi:HAD family hydrolase [Vibrio vulnificus]|nr:HAD family hydrolase [Vibrio vulnificus]EHU4943796.1 HAD family hydrolase [Vibrio vulnificus]MCU8421643.1 HAD family hydrolase [Vibrio vulnificus]MCU8456883.1 HAD family hydrolase [Vibrio vulnificus]
MRDNRIKVAFLDRDGVINKEVNYLYQKDKFEFTSDCLKGLKILKRLGYSIIVITNQAGIARGYYTENDYQILTDYYTRLINQQNVEILKVYHCPHHPNGKIEQLAIDCKCRKPRPGMLYLAMKEFDIDIENSILIGDKVSDCEAGLAAGIKCNFLVESGHGLTKEERESFKTFSCLYDVACYLRSSAGKPHEVR